MINAVKSCAEIQKSEQRYTLLIDAVCLDFIACLFHRTQQSGFSE